MPGFHTSQDILLAVISTTNKNPFTQFTSETLVDLMQQNISKSNARKNITSLKNLGILDAHGVPTELGLRWANEKTRSEATESIIKNVFPPGTSDAAKQYTTSRDFALWLSSKGNVTQSVASKNATTFRTLQSVSENIRNKRAKQKSRQDLSTNKKLYLGVKRTLYIPKNISEQQFRMIMSVTKDEAINIVMT